MSTLEKRARTGDTQRALRVDHLFKDLFNGTWDAILPGQEWVPPTDVIETDDAYLVAADLPGVNPETIEVTLQDECLEISGNRAAPTLASGARAHSRHRPHGPFRCLLRLPTAVDINAAEARDEQGVLHVTLPKRAEARRQRIPIRTAPQD